MKYKYWILVLSKQLRKSGDWCLFWSFYVTYHILFYLMGFVPSI